MLPIYPMSGAIKKIYIIRRFRALILKKKKKEKLGKFSSSHGDRK